MLVESAFVWVGQVQDALLFVVVTSETQLFFQFLVAQSQVLGGAISLLLFRRFPFFYETIFISFSSHLPFSFRSDIFILFWVYSFLQILILLLLSLEKAHSLTVCEHFLIVSIDVSFLETPSSRFASS